jgi:hypothetical protein
VLPRVRRGDDGTGEDGGGALPVVYVASGGLPEGLWPALHEWAGRRVRVADKAALGYDAAAVGSHIAEGDAKASTYKGFVRLYATSAVAAAVDLVVLGRAAEVVLTAFSSLTMAVYARRCCRGPAGAPSATVPPSAAASVWLYDVDLNGTMSRATAGVPCGHSLPPYLEGLAPLPAALDVFRPNFDPTTPLWPGRGAEASRTAHTDGDGARTLSQTRRAPDGSAKDGNQF